MMEISSISVPKEDGEEQARPVPGESNDPDSDEVKREKDDNELVPEDDFEETYGGDEKGKEKPATDSGKQQKNSE